MRVTNKLERHLSVEEEKHMYQVCDDDFLFSKLPREEQERLKRIPKWRTCIFKTNSYYGT